MSTFGDQDRESNSVRPGMVGDVALRQRTSELESALREAERTNQSLRESEAQFRSMADNSLIGIAIIVDGKHAYTNQALNEIFGYNAEEILLLNPLSLTAESDRDFAAEKLRQALASEIERTEFSLKALRKDGTDLDIEVSGSAMMVAGKRALIVLTRDVSLRTLSERRLRESEESLRTMAASVRDAILMIDNDGKITFWNDAAERIFGYTSAEAIGQVMHALLVPPRYEHSYREPFSRFQTTGEGAAIGVLREMTAIRKDGTEFPVEISLASVQIEGKWNAVGVVRDISDRKLLERTREQRTERILAHAVALDTIAITERQLDIDLSQLSRVIDEQVARATGVARASIWLFNAQETQLHCIDLYELGDARHSDGAILSEEQFASEFESLKRAPCIAADDALTDPRTAGYADTYLEPLGITSMLDAVIEVSGKHLGVLCLEHVRHPHRWREDEIAFASEVAARIGMALLTRSRLQAEQALRESERRLSSIFDNVELISIMLDSEARLTYCNDYLLRLSGWQREEIIGRRWQEVFWLPHEAERMQSILSNALTGTASAWHHQSEIVMRNGERRTVYWNNTVLRSPDGDVLGVASLGQDITEREAAQKKLKLFRALVDESNDAIELIDSETSRLIDVNNRACSDLGYSRDELLCLSISDIDGDSDPANASAIEEGLANEGFVVVESSHRRKDGSVFPVELSLRRIALDKSYVVAVARDISERKRAEAEVQALQERLREQAIHDPLTGLYNRRFLEESLDRELIRAKRSGDCVSAIMGDLDHFKRVNDEYGHRAGDEVLRAFAKLLKSNSRGSDVDCRYGCEEFLLLLPGSTNKTACARAEVLRAALAATTVPFEGVDIVVTGSFGVATYPEHALTGDNLVAAADKALYAAKQSGRNRVMSCAELGA
jgi:diguanylate cyclase (GGDEF)-like protein/PAS domain S-box-containing protein